MLPMRVMEGQIAKAASNKLGAASKRGRRVPSVERGPCERENDLEGHHHCFFGFWVSAYLVGGGRHRPRGCRIQ